MRVAVRCSGSRNCATPARSDTALCSSITLIAANTLVPACTGTPIAHLVVEHLVAVARVGQRIATRGNLREQRGQPLRSSGEVGRRSEEHTSELPSLMRISYAVFCLQKQKQ